MVFFYVTNESHKEAKEIAKHLLEKRMIGCANMYPVNAMYWQDDEIADDEEWVLIVKTTTENAERVRQEIDRIHPFDIPCIIKLDVDPNEKYLKWIESEMEEAE